MEPSEGRGEVMETKGRSLKAATPRAPPSWGHRSNSVPDLKGQQVESHNGKTERNKTTRTPSGTLMNP